MTFTVNTALGQSANKEQRAFWNGFVEYLETKGLKGSPKLDKPGHGNSVELFNEYCKLKGVKLSYTAFVTQVQTTIAAYRAAAWAQVESGKARFDGKESEFMPGLSVIDGWAGSRTTTYKFPPDSIAVVADGKNIRFRTNKIYDTMAGSDTNTPKL